jgi:hypothetical protein
MKNKYPTKKQTIIWNDIRSGHKPEGNRMLYILWGTDIATGGYDKDGKFFWDGNYTEPIPMEEITAWAYLSIPDFTE